MVRAKFRVQSLTQHAGWDGKPVASVLVTMTPVHCNRQHADEADKARCESHSYSEATPSGKLEMLVTNERAFGEFRPGAEFYLEFKEAAP